MGRCPNGAFADGPFGGGQKKTLQTEIQNDIVQEIEALLGRQAIRDLDFEAVEMAARRQALRLTARALEQRLNADTSDHTGSEVPCSCGEPAQYHGRHQKTFESVLGPLHLERAYYYCAQCQSGFCPRDRALRLEIFSLTPGVLRMTGSTAAMVSFEESSALLQELAGVEVSPKQVERAAEALGAEIAADERGCVEKMGAVAPTMYLGMDGTGVPVRKAEVAGRAGKQPDGSAKTRDAKLVTLWTAESRDEEGKPCAMPDRSLIRQRLKLPLLRIRAPNGPTSPSAYCAKRLGEASRKHPAARCWAMALPGFGTPPGNCSPKPLRFSTGSTPKKLCTEPLKPSSAQPMKASNGQRHAALNWMMANCTPSSTLSNPMPLPSPKRPNVRGISSAIAPACATPSFTHKVCVPPPACSRLDAKW